MAMARCSFRISIASHRSHRVVVATDLFPKKTFYPRCVLALRFYAAAYRDFIIVDRVVKTFATFATTNARNVANGNCR